MRGFLNITALGQVCNDPMVRDTPTGRAASLRFAVSEQWTRSDGTPGDRTTFHTLLFWNKLADIAANNLRTGMTISITAGLRYRVDPNGKVKTELHVHDLYIISPANGAEDEAHAAESPLPVPQTPGRTARHATLRDRLPQDRTL